MFNEALSLDTARHIGRARLNKLLLAVIYLLPLACIFDSECFKLISYVYITSFAYFMFCEEFAALYPILFFFYNYLVTPSGIVVYRVYTVLFIIRFAFLFFKRKPRFSISRLCIIALMFFAVGGLFFQGSFVGVGAVTDLVFMSCFVLLFRSTEDGGSDFFIFFVFGAVISVISGFFADGYLSKLLDPECTEELRYLATLEDPNYLGFYLNIAVAVILLHPLFKNLALKLISLAFIYIGIVASGSATAMLCNIFTLCVCVFFLIKMKRFKLRQLCAVIVLAAVGVQLLLLSRDSDWGFVSKASSRWIEKLVYLVNGELSEFTTTRSDIWRINMVKFAEQPFWRQLFGGNYVTAVGHDQVNFLHVSHQEYIDILLCTGIFGLVFFLFCLVFTVSDDVVRVKKQKELAYIRLAFKAIWIFYGFGLTMFLNSRFYIFLLL